MATLNQNTELVCTVCNLPLSGKKTRFCSLKCKNSDLNRKHQNYVLQQERGTERRSKLIQMKGGKCEICGYHKNHAALCFHHLDESQKSFGIDLRRCSNCSWEKLVSEDSKCQLLCHNCHMELHFPEFSQDTNSSDFPLSPVLYR
jgi:endogenous inhibitor of DNA gyrase (YacG/DUF329 family)